MYLYVASSNTHTSPLSLHDALPIYVEFTVSGKKPYWFASFASYAPLCVQYGARNDIALNFSVLDRKSTRLNSSHVAISYAVICLKKKKVHHDVRCSHDII